MEWQGSNRSVMDYRVKPESPALTVGFQNFDMGNWGLQDDFPTVWEDLKTKGKPLA